jgi:hypothetical protein
MALFISVIREESQPQDLMRYSFPSPVINQDISISMFNFEMLKETKWVASKALG